MESSFWSCSFAAGLDEVDDTQRIIKSEERLQEGRIQASGRDKRFVVIALSVSTVDRDNIKILTTTASDEKNYQQVLLYEDCWKRQDNFNEAKKSESEFEHPNS
jgi:hypothetical protein